MSTERKKFFFLTNFNIFVAMKHRRDNKTKNISLLSTNIIPRLQSRKKYLEQDREIQ